MRLAVASLALAAASGVPAVARADPQWNAALVTGLCGRGDGEAFWADTCWYNAGRADVILGRNRNADFGIGPHLFASTADFDDLRLGAGATLHVPAHAYVPALLSASGYARSAGASWQPGVAAELFLGSRSYNFHGSYVMATGLVLGYHHGLGATPEHTVVVALQLDGLLTAMPLLLGYQWIRGPSDD